MTQKDFVSIGDTVVDDFILLKDAAVHCKVDTDTCELCVRFGDKIPFESSTVVYGVGNAANAAVASARLGLSTALISNVGKDERGEKILDYFKSEDIDTSHITVDPHVPTNYHYVLSYESERTILVKQNAYSYTFPKDLPEPKTIYFSSVNEKAVEFRDQLIAYLEEHPQILFAFQPGVFEIKCGAQAFARFYKRANLVVCNKEEAERILDMPAETGIKELLTGFETLGTNNVVITDGRNGAYGRDEDGSFFVPLYPDPRPPIERTGSGDAFASTTAVALTLGKPLKEALLWGPVNAMSVVQEIGAQKGLLSREGLEDLLAEAPSEYRVTEL